MSSTGVLFRTRSFLHNDTALEVKLLVPGATLDAHPVRLVCLAQVLRSLKASALESRVAARLASYEFEAAVHPLRPEVQGALA